MGDLLDKETKQFLLIFAGICIFLLLIYPRIDKSLMNLNFSDPINSFANVGVKTSPVPSNITNIDATKDYSATVNTTLGSFQIDLFEKSSPKNVANVIASASKYSTSPIQVVEKNFLFRVDVKEDPKETTEDEINADYIGLDRIKVGDAIFLKKEYDQNNPATNTFSPENLNRYEQVSVKEFYASQLGYKYNPTLETPKAKKYTVYLTSKGPNQNGLDFFILMSDNAPQVDGRYTPIGQVTSGFDVLDKINDSNTNPMINSFSVSVK